MGKNILEIKNLNVVYNTKENILGQSKIVFAVNDVSLDVKKGEILAIAGESGCGKSTLAKAIMKLVEVKSGEIIFEGKNVLTLKAQKDLQKFYKSVQMIFQNPYSSLNPKMKIGQILAEPLVINTKINNSEIKLIVEDKISKVGLDKNCLNLYPHEFSGGQRQRIAIARALVPNPEFIIADEPVSALDVSIQAQIINLLKQLKEEFNLTFLFISHDLSVIKYLSDRIAIMYLGEIIEIGKTDEIFAEPKHPYTKALLSAVPKLSSENPQERMQLNGELPSHENILQGCKFHTRCPFSMDVCSSKVPLETSFSPTHTCKCFLYNQ
jgi:peptide/nickel transport system ATP-binding protein/oligopeptide transport system ATP-binding protein